MKVRIDHSVGITTSLVIVMSAGWPHADARSPSSRPVADRSAGLVIAVSRESLAERAWRTTGGRTYVPTYNEKQDWEVEHSDQTLKALRDIGINMLVFPYGGHGPDSQEHAERSLIGDFAARARAEGFLTGLWLPVEAVSADQWSAASQPVDDWTVHERDGSAAAGRERGLVVTSTVSPAAVRRVDRLIREAVRDVGPSAILLPDLSFGVGYERASRDAFRVYLAARGPDAGGAGAGIDASKAEPPDTASPDALKTAWLRYRCGALSGRLGSIRAQLAKREGSAWLGAELPAALVPRSFDSASIVDLGEAARQSDFVWVDGKIQTDSLARIHTQVAVLRAISDAGARPIAVCQDGLEVAQAMAFGGDPGLAIGYFNKGQFSCDSSGRRPVTFESIGLARFFRKHHELYAGTQRVADVVLVRPSCKDAGIALEMQGQFVQTESALAVHNILYSVHDAVAQELNNAGQTMLVTGASVLDESALDHLERRVRGGGGLVLVGRPQVMRGGASGARERLQDAVVKATGAVPASIDGQPGDGVRCWTLGKGRIVAMEEPGPVAHFWFKSRPGATGLGSSPLPCDDGLVRAIRWAHGGRLSLNVCATSATVVEVRRSAGHRRTMIHEVCFNPRVPERAHSIRCVLEAAQRVKRVMHFTPQSGEEGTVAFRQADDTVTIEAGPCSLYELYVVETEPAK